jgi:catechol 2,3-dioxygenase-like lactoylglutathione lyase family enzyme
VFVPVADQDRALEFYLDKLGFEQRADLSYGEGSRWVEVGPPGSAIAIALVPPSEGGTAGGDKTHCVLATADPAGRRRATVVGRLPGIAPFVRFPVVSAE